jgi:hypothetical protein
MISSWSPRVDRAVLSSRQRPVGPTGDDRGIDTAFGLNLPLISSGSLGSLLAVFLNSFQNVLHVIKMSQKKLAHCAVTCFCDIQLLNLVHSLMILAEQNNVLSPLSQSSPISLKTLKLSTTSQTETSSSTLHLLLHLRHPPKPSRNLVRQLLIHILCTKRRTNTQPPKSNTRQINRLKRLVISRLHRIPYRRNNV